MIGVGVIGFDRPHYLRRTLAGLAQQQGAEFECVLFLDGAVNEFSGRVAGSEDLLKHSWAMFQKMKLPGNGIGYRRGHNLGIGLHQYQATKWMVGRYDRIVMIEDDVVLSPHWLRLVGVLFDQFSDHGDIFGFSPGFKKLGGDLGALRYINEHWWCEAFTARTWWKMHPYYATYIDLIEGVDYRDRDHAAIRKLWHRWNWTHPATSQDAAKDGAIRQAGMRRLVCEVNRAIGIGRYGQHFYPDLFAHKGYEQQAPFTFDEDRTRMQFDEPISTGASTTQG